MNRLLQHFVDSSGGARGAPASRPPIPAPPQSSGGSYHAGNRGSYQRAAAGGPFYYQPPPHPPAQTHWQHSEGRAASGLEEIPLTSQSTGGLYETVDLNADSSQQHRPQPQQHQPQRLFSAPAPGHRPPSAPNSQTPPMYKAPTPPSSREGRQQPYQAPGSTGSAADLFAGGPPAREMLGGPPSSGGSGGNPYRRQSNPSHNPFAAPVNGGRVGNSTPPEDPFGAGSPANGAVSMFGSNMSPQTDPFSSSPTQNGGGMLAQTRKDPFAASHSQENRNVFGNGTLAAGESAHDPFAVQPPKDTGFRHDQHGQQQQLHEQPQQFQQQPKQVQQPASPAAHSFASTPYHPGSSPFDSPTPSNGGHQRMASADSLFATPAPSHNGGWAQPAPQTQPVPSPVQAQELFASEAPSASSLFGGSALSPFQIQSSFPTPPKPSSPPPAQPQVCIPPSPAKSQIAPPSPAKSQFSSAASPMRPPVAAPPSPMRPPVAAPPSPMINASSPPMRPQVTVPASPVMRPEDHLTPAFGSMKLSTPVKSPLKSGLDVRHMKFPAGKREDDAMSNAPSIAPSRMSMLSTLDDSLKLSDMYKQMTARLEGEKHDLLRVVASQAHEIAQMKKHIKSLELQLKKCRPQDA